MDIVYTVLPYSLFMVILIVGVLFLYSVYRCHFSSPREDTEIVMPLLEQRCLSLSGTLCYPNTRKPANGSHPYKFIYYYTISGRQHQLILYRVYDIENGFCHYSVSYIHCLDYCIYRVRIMHSDVVEDIKRKAFSIQREKLEGMEKLLPFKCG